jgi:hypothetical protein
LTVSFATNGVAALHLTFTDAPTTLAHGDLHRQTLKFLNRRVSLAWTSTRVAIGVRLSVYVLLQARQIDNDQGSSPVADDSRF